MAQPPQSDAPDRREWYRTMLLIRAFEDKVQQLFSQGLILGTTHPARARRPCRSVQSVRCVPMIT